jgi:hypothetical protein
MFHSRLNNLAIFPEGSVICMYIQVGKALTQALPSNSGVQGCSVAFPTSWLKAGSAHLLEGKLQTGTVLHKPWTPLIVTLEIPKL